MRFRSITLYSSRSSARAYFTQIYPLVKKATGLLNYEGMLYFDPVPLIGQIPTEINTRLIPLFIGTKEGPVVWNATLDIRIAKDYGAGKLRICLSSCLPWKWTL